MSAFISIQELVDGGCLPTGEREGILAILRAYVDDAGTHDDSNVTVMGGLIGTVDQWLQFEQAWAAKLADPLPGYGKPALSAFHLSACNARDGEFSAYNDAEQDAIIHDFRQIIIDARLTSVAAIVDKRAWDQLIVGPIRNVLGPALAPCFEKCLEEIIRFANPHPHGHNIAVWFDKGVQNAYLEGIGDLWTRPLMKPRLKSVNFARIVDLMPLQGADIVATENYWHAAASLKFGIKVSPRPHLRHFLDNMLHEALILDRKGIEGEVRRRGRDGHVLGT
jgi:hypothetical protein